MRDYYMKINDLLEARSNPDHPSQPSRDVYDNISKYFGKDNIFLSFQNINKIGINPKPNHGTPLGFYAYPLISYEHNLKRNKDRGIKNILNVFPYGDGRQFIKIFTVTSEPIDVMDYNSFDQDKEKLINIFGDEIVNNSIREKYIDKTQFEKIYDLTFRLALFHANGSDVHFFWNKLLRKIGFESIVDYGHGFIHSMERSQALFLTTKTIKPLETIETF